MVARGRKTAKSVKAPQRAKSTRKAQSTRPRSRKTKSGERRADKPKSETARLKSLLRDAEDRQTATAEILKVIASSPDDVQPVFQAIAERSNRLVNGLSTTVLSIVHNTVHLSAFTKTTPNADAELTAWFPRELSALPYGDHIRRGEIFRLPDTEADPVLRGIARARGYRSIVFVPLLHDGFAIGMIGQTKSESGPFAENHVELLKTFADQAVIAISNVRLFQEVQERTRELSASLDDLRFAQDRLVQTEKLAALGRLVAGVAHEINTPIGTSLTVASTLESKTATFAAEAARETLRRSTLTEFLEASREASLQLTANLNQAAGLIQSFKQVAADQNYTDPRVFDLGELTEQIAKSLRSGLRKRSVTFNVTCQPNLVFNSHPGPYGQVLTNLFLNATAHAFPDATSGTISINVQAAGDDAAEVFFSDDGCGMTSDVRRKAFDPFFTTSRDQGNAGLGLHIVHSIVTTCLGGTLDLDSEPGKGTKIKLRLPLVAPVGAAPDAY